MGRAISILTLFDLGAKLGLRDGVQIVHVEFDPIMRSACLVLDGSAVTERDRGQSFEPTCRPLDDFRSADGRERMVIRDDGMTGERTFLPPKVSDEEMFRRLYQQPVFVEQCDVHVCALVKGHKPEELHESSDGVQFTMTGETEQYPTPIEPTAEDIAAKERQARDFPDPRMLHDQGDEITAYGVERDRVSGFGPFIVGHPVDDPDVALGIAAGIMDALRTVEAAAEEILRAEREETHEAAVCPSCSGGLLRREVGAVRALLGDHRGMSVPGPVLVCVDCGHRVAVGSYEVVEGTNGWA